MELITLEEIYKKYPQLQNIANRLHLSVASAEKQNKELKERRSSKPEGSVLKSYVVSPEHAAIEKFYAEGKWQNTYHPLQSGKEAFEINLERIMGQNPEAIKILIVNGPKESPRNKSQKIEISFKSDAAIPPDEKEAVKSDVVDALRTELGSLKEQFKSSSIKTDQEGQHAISALNYGQRLTEIEHKYQIEGLKRDHKEDINALKNSYEKQIDELNDEIDELTEDIEYLEAEKAESEESLKGIGTEIEKYKNPTMFTAFGKVLANAAEHLIKENATGLGKAFKIDPKDIKDIFEVKETEEKEAAQTENKGGFSDAPGSDNEAYNSLDAQKKEIADAFINVCHNLEMDQLQKLLGAFQFVLNEDGTVNMPILLLTYQTGKTAKEAADKAAKESAENETKNN